MKLVYRPEALADLDTYLGQIRSDNPRAVAETALDIAAFAVGIEAPPGLGFSDPDTGVFERIVPEYSLAFVYRVSASLIDVVAVLHTARDPAIRRW